MFVVVYNCFSLPFKVAFSPDLLDSTFFNLIARIIDLIFFLDILINFRTMYIDGYGNEIKCPYKIAKDYLKFTFWIDLIATVPFDAIASSVMTTSDTSIELLGILKFGRLLKLKKIIAYLNVVEEVRHLISLIKHTFFIMIFLHNYACYMWYMMNDKKIWISPKFIPTGDWY